MTEESEPVSVYLDVDGVLCPYGVRGASDWEGGWRHARVGWLRVRYAPGLVEALNTLSHEPGVSCVWLTTWEEMAPRHLCPAIGLDGADWPVLRPVPRHLPEAGGPDGSGFDGRGWWKLAAIRRDLSRRAGRAVWIDDQLADDDAAAAWLAASAPLVLGIAPQPGIGITRRELHLVRDFLAVGPQSGGPQSGEPQSGEPQSCEPQAGGPQSGGPQPSDA